MTDPRDEIFRIVVETIGDGVPKIFGERLEYAPAFHRAAHLIGRIIAGDDLRSVQVLTHSGLQVFGCFYRTVAEARALRDTGPRA